MSRQRSALFVVACPDCAVDRRTDDPAEVVAFFRRHRRVTGHEPVFESADVPLRDVPEEGEETPGEDDETPEEDGKTPEEDEVKAAIRALEPEFEDGVPVGVVAAVMHERGVSIAETLDRIYAVRMRGGLYEPREDHLGAF